MFCVCVWVEQQEDRNYSGFDLRNLCMYSNPLISKFTSKIKWFWGMLQPRCHMNDCTDSSRPHAIGICAKVSLGCSKAVVLSIGLTNLQPSTQGSHWPRVSNDINCIRNHSILPDPAYTSIFQCLQPRFASPQRHSCGFFRLAVVLVVFRFNHRIGEPVSGVPYLNSKGAMAERYWKMLRVGLLSMADKNWASTCLNEV